MGKVRTEAAPGFSCHPHAGGPTALRLLVELIHEPACPHVTAAREMLAAVLREAGVPAVWTEWTSDDPGCPAKARGLGSPTILVNGEDVAPGPHPWAPRAEGSGPSCRMYLHADGALVGVPPRALLSDAISRALEPQVG